MSKGRNDVPIDGTSPVTGKWNTAKEYSQLMIMKPLYECNEFQRLCYHGTLEILDEFLSNELDRNKIRLTSLERYITTLLMLCSNTKGQVKPENKVIIEEMKLKLQILYNALPTTKVIINKIAFNQNYEVLEINERAYSYILKEVVRINEDLSEVLTKEDLVFYNIEDWDMDKAKEEFMNKFVEEG